MGKPFSRIVGDENVSDSEGTLFAYSYSSGELEQKPRLVLWPQTTEQVARVLRESNQSRAHIVLRGAGTSTSNAAIGTNAIVLSSEKMNRVLRIDANSKSLEAQGGARLAELNKALEETELTIPFTTLKNTETLGGLLAINSYARESEQLGQFSTLVEEIDFVDGTGKIFQTRKLENVAGKEGLSGMITRLKIRLITRPTLTIDVFQYDEPTELLKKIGYLKNDKERYFVEFVDKKLAARLGLQEKLTLIVAYITVKGRHGTVADAREIINKLDALHSSLMQGDYYYTIDARVSVEKTYDLVDWCEKEQIPLRGYAGNGVFFAYFKKEEKSKMSGFRNFIRGIYGRIGIVSGTGSANADFVTNDERKALIKLKDEFDYNNTLNPGKMIQYR